MATKKSGLPYFYATGLAKILVGEQPCHLEQWLKAHYEIDKLPRSSSFAKWNAEHASQLQAEGVQLIHEGWKCTVERFFRLAGKTAVLGGKPDIIAQKDGCRPKIIDIKSGKPQDSHAAQLCLYMAAIPLVWQSPHMIFAGELVYPTHRVQIDINDVQPMWTKATTLLKQLATDVRPTAVPSEQACRFCEVTSVDCDKRFVGETVAVSTAEF